MCQATTRCTSLVALLTGSTKLPEVSFAFDSKVTCLVFVSEELLVVGTDDGALVWIRTAARAVTRRESLPSRVRDVALLSATSVVAVTSTGHVAVYEEGKSEPSATVNLDDRLTCVATTPLPPPLAEHAAADTAAEPKTKKSKGARATK